MATTTMNYGSWTAMTVTNLQSLANDSTDPFGGWQSDRVDNLSSVKAMDYEIVVKLTTAATAGANDKAAYVYLIPWMYDGSTWYPGANFGTTTEPTGSEGTCSITEPNTMRSVQALTYKDTSQLLRGYFSVCSRLGVCPDGWSLAIRNCTGAALSTSCVVAYKAIKFDTA